MKVVALDLGTNTFLCLGAEGNSKTGISKVHFDLHEVVRLGEKVNQTGMLQPQALKRAKECFEKFKPSIDAFQPDKILALATSAARDSENGDELFKLGNQFGIPIEIIEGEREARISFLGAVGEVGGDAKEDSGKTYMIIDVGGGSTEFIVGRKSPKLEILFAESLDIGGVRLTEMFVQNRPIPQQEQLALVKKAHEEVFSLVARLPKYKVDEIIAVAGTPTSLAAIEVGGFDESKVHGHLLSKDSLKNFKESFAGMTVEEIQNKYKLGGRSDIIFAGTSILLEALMATHANAMRVSTRGVRYGLAMEMLGTN